MALAWTLCNPAVTAPIIGARTLAQLQDNLGALEITLDDAHLSRLDTVSGIELGFPHTFLARPMTKAIMSGDVRIESRRRA